MTAATPAGDPARPAAAAPAAAPTEEPRWLRWTLTGVVLAAARRSLLFAPLAAVFAEALREGLAGAALEPRSASPTRWPAIRLTLHRRGDGGAAQRGLRHRRGLGDRQVRVARQGVPPHADRPALLGLAGGGGALPRAALRRQLARSAAGSSRNGFQVVFAVPGIVLATMFITFPFVARELDPADDGAGHAPRRRRR